MIITILATVVVLGVLIFVHELGHFLTAKAVDIEVPRFSIGFGPKVFGFKRGETEYVLSLLPLGGYVKMAGTEDMEVIEGGPGTANDTGVEIEPAVRTPGPRDFDAKSLPARTLVISAGVIMNLIFAVVAFTTIALVWGVPADPGTTLAGVSEEALPASAMSLAQIRPGMKVIAVNDRPVDSWRELQTALTSVRAGETELRFETGAPIKFDLPATDTGRIAVMSALEPVLAIPPVIGLVQAGDPADKGGVKTGDRVLQVDGVAIATWSQLVDAIERGPGKPLTFLIDRKGEQVTLTVTPRDDERGGVHYGRIGIGGSGGAIPTEDTNIFGAVKQGFSETTSWVTQTVDFLAGMFTGRQSPKNLGGPIMITQLSGQVAREGMQSLLRFMAILSVNLAVLNMLPIPVLDGGHLVFLLIEAVRGRALSIEQRMRWTQVGFFIIVGIMLWAVGNDIFRLVSGFVS